MRGIIFMLVQAGLFVVALFIAVPVFDTLVPVVNTMTPEKYSGTVNNIHAVTVKWVVVIFAAIMFMYAVLWILRRERQEVRRP